MMYLSALCPQDTPKEVVSISNMGKSKRGPIIESRDHLLLEFTDGSACESDGLQLTYTTRIHLVCSRGSGVSDPGRRDLGFCRLCVCFLISPVFFAVTAPPVPAVQELHRHLQVGNQGSMRHHHHQEQCEFHSSRQVSERDGVKGSTLKTFLLVCRTARWWTATQVSSSTCSF